MVGSEHAGIRPEVLRACAWRVRIPMMPNVDSLAITSAAAIVLARLREAGNQARNPGGDQTGEAGEDGRSITQKEVAEPIISAKSQPSVSVFACGVAVGVVLVLSLGGILRRPGGQ